MPKAGMKTESRSMSRSRRGRGERKNGEVAEMT
jgi:hypothetical protein